MRTIFLICLVQCAALYGEVGLDIRRGRCILQGISSPKALGPFEGTFSSFQKTRVAGNRVKVTSHEEVGQWCFNRRWDIAEGLAESCNGITLGGHAGYGGVTDFMSCHCTGNGTELKFLEDEQNGQRQFDQILRCLKDVLKPGTELTIASCAGLYEAGPLCAHYIAKTHGIRVKTTGGSCRSSLTSYATAPSWITWTQDGKKPDLQKCDSTFQTPVEGVRGLRQIEEHLANPDRTSEAAIP